MGFWLVAGLLSLVLLYQHAVFYLPFLSDDALISLRYAQRLLEGHGLTWTAGRPVEGYSNLLWVLANAVLGWFGVDLIESARILGFVGMGAAIAAVLSAHHPSQCCPPASPPPSPAVLLPALVGTLILALSDPIAIWVVGGLEQPLVAALLAWATVLCYPLLEHDDIALRSHMVQVPGLLYGLQCITRPDGVLFAVAAAMAVLLVRRFDRSGVRYAAGLMVLPVVFYVGQLGFRLAYYGEWVPNTALVKLGFSAKRVQEGLTYVQEGASHMVPLFIMAGFALILALWKQFAWRKVVFLLVPMVVWTAYVVAIGGDIFPGRRHLVPLIVLLALLASEGAGWLARHGTPRGLVLGQAAFAYIALFIWLSGLQARDPSNVRATHERWEWDAQVAAYVLKQAFGDEEPLVAVEAAGSIPYWSELPAIDMLGLNDYHIARNRPENFGEGVLGHELRDDDYVLELAPDIIIFQVGQGIVSGMMGMPEFTRAYTRTWFLGTTPYERPVAFWVRRSSAKVGIERSGDTIGVPAYLLNTNGEPVPYANQVLAYIDDEGEPVVPVTADKPVYARYVQLLPGKWEVDVEISMLPYKPSEPGEKPIALVVRDYHTQEILVSGHAPLTFTLSSETVTRVDVEVTLPDGTEGAIEVRQLVLREVGE